MYQRAIPNKLNKSNDCSATIYLSAPTKKLMTSATAPPMDYVFMNNPTNLRVFHVFPPTTLYQFYILTLLFSFSQFQINTIRIQHIVALNRCQLNVVVIWLINVMMKLMLIVSLS